MSEHGGRTSGIDSEHGIELDLERGSRRGYPEAVYCEGKTPAQVARIARLVHEAAEGSAVGGVAGAVSTAAGDTTADDDPGDDDPAGDDPAGDDPAADGLAALPRSRTTLFTRARPEHVRAVLEELPDAFVDERARLLAWPPTPPEPTGGLVVVAAAGTSDQPIALEAAHTARFLGRAVESVDDIGIAGVHRTLARVDLLRSAAAIVVVAGMDGALPGLVAGLVSAPVIAVPTSVGYGAAFEGMAALLTMLNACAPGVAVVNIDNGYGAGHLAAQIARHAPAGSVAGRRDS